jgi:branched-chain amino acid transport system permease protein
MSEVVQVLVSGLIVGVLYALIAGGLNLIFGVFGVLNLAHGEFVLGGAFTAWYLHDGLGWHPLLCLVASAVVTFVLGVGLQALLIERVLDQSVVMSLILLFGVSLSVQGLGVRYFGVTDRTLAYFSGSFDIFGWFLISKTRLVAVAVAAVVLVAVHLYLRYTKMGIATKATAQNAQIAEACGINVKAVRHLTMGMATGMAGIAGGLVIMIFPFNPQSGFQYAIIAFVIAVVGGLGSFYGSVLAGVVLGAGQGLVGYYTTSQLSVAIMYLFLILVLVIRPSGFGGVAKAIGR